MAIDALKIESSSSTPSSIVARTPFTLTTILINVHDDTIEVLEYCYYFPYQVQWIHENDHIRSYDKYKSLNILAKLFSKSP